MSRSKIIGSMVVVVLFVLVVPLFLEHTFIHSPENVAFGSSPVHRRIVSGGRVAMPPVPPPSDCDPAINNCNNNPDDPNNPDYGSPFAPHRKGTFSVPVVNPCGGTAAYDVNTGLPCPPKTSSSSSAGSAAANASSPRFTENHGLWDRGGEIPDIQRYMREQGHPVTAAGEETDLYGRHTSDSVAEWQVEHDLPGTGFWGERSRAIANATI